MLAAAARRTPVLTPVSTTAAASARRGSRAHASAAAIRNRPATSDMAGEPDKQPAAAASAGPAAAASASSSSALAAALAAHTEVVDFQSPPEVVAAKAQQLAAIGPTSWGLQMLMRLVSLPVWAGLAVTLLKRYATRPMAALRPPNPARFKMVPPFPLHEEFISVNGIRLHTVSPGRRRDKPLLMMVHGFPECWYSWRHQMAAFADDWDVVAIDMRGYNTSDKPRGVDAYQLHRLAADVKAAVSALGHSRCTLMAHDWGGTVAWVVAGLYGSDLLERLVVLALPHTGIAMTNLSAAQRQRSMYMLLFQAPLLPELLISGGDAELLGDMFTSPPNGLVNAAAWGPHDSAWFRAAMCQPGAATAALNYYRALWRFMTGSDKRDPVWQALRRPLDDIPTLVLHGAEDMALGVELLDGIEAAVPQGTVKLMKRCSHWVQQDYPQQVNGIIAEWLAQHGGGSSASG